MKAIHIVLWLSAICALLASAACGIAQASNNDSASPAVNPNTAQFSGTAADLTEVQKLGIGIILLDGNSLPVSAEQAGQLAILWKALRNLSLDEAAIEPEKNALIQQIHDTLTAEQQQAIGSMNLNLTSLREMANKLGVDLASGPGSSTPERLGTPPANVSGNAFGPGDFAGGPPADGGFMREAGGAPFSQNSGADPLTSSSGGLGLPDQLVQALIQYLVEKSIQ